MKFQEVDVYALIRALRRERSRWIDLKQLEGRKHTESETATICILAALENALSDAAAESDPDLSLEQGGLE